MNNKKVKRIFELLNGESLNILCLNEAYLNIMSGKILNKYFCFEIKSMLLIKIIKKFKS